MGVRTPRVLVVDDHAVFRRGLVSALETLGYTATAVGDVEGALGALDREPFDAVLLDLRMPGLNGYALLRVLSERDDAIPVIAMSGEGTMDDVITLMRAHAADFLRKPIQPSELASALDRALAKGKATHETSEAQTPGPTEPQPAAAPSPPTTTTPRAGTRARTPTAEPTRPETPETAQTPSRQVDRIVRALEQGQLELPAIAPIAGQIQRLMGDPMCAVGDVLEVVGTDPVIAGSILAIANSAHLRAGQPITDLRSACLRVGNKRVLATAQQVLLRDRFAVAEGADGELLDAMWHNVVVTAHGARALAVRIGLPDPDEVQVAAMLHNLGELVLLRMLSGLRGGRPFGPTALAQAAEQIALRHETVGRMLLAGWDMP